MTQHKGDKVLLGGVYSKSMVFFLLCGVVALVMISCRTAPDDSITAVTLQPTGRTFPHVNGIIRDSQSWSMPLGPQGVARLDDSHPEVWHTAPLTDYVDSTNALERIGVRTVLEVAPRTYWIGLVGSRVPETSLVQVRFSEASPESEPVPFPSVFGVVSLARIGADIIATTSSAGSFVYSTETHQWGQTSQRRSFREAHTFVAPDVILIGGELPNNTPLLLASRDAGTSWSAYSSLQFHVLPGDAIITSVCGGLLETDPIFLVLYSRFFDSIVLRADRSLTSFVVVRRSHARAFVDCDLHEARHVVVAGDSLWLSTTAGDSWIATPAAGALGPILLDWTNDEGLVAQLRDGLDEVVRVTLRKGKSGSASVKTISTP